MAKFCADCGAEIKDGQDVCLGCGKVLNKTTANNNTTDISKEDKAANTGFILGLVSLIAWLIPLFGYPVTICGIVYSSKGLKSTSKKTKAIIGLVFSIIFLIFTLSNSILGVIEALNAA